MIDKKSEFLQVHKQCNEISSIYKDKLLGNVSSNHKKINVVQKKLLFVYSLSKIGARTCHSMHKSLHDNNNVMSSDGDFNYSS